MSTTLIKYYVLEKVMLLLFLSIQLTVLFDMINLGNIYDKSLLIAPILLIVSILHTGCANGQTTSILGPKLNEKIKSNSSPAIVDVRSVDEYKSGHVPGAINIPFWSVFTRHSKIPTSKEEPIILYCEHGSRVKLAKLAFRIMGYQQILYLEGHMVSWKEAGLPIEKPSSP